MTYKKEMENLLNDLKDMKNMQGEDRLPDEVIEEAFNIARTTVQKQYQTFSEVREGRFADILDICEHSELVCEFDMDEQGEASFLLISSTPDNIPFITKFTGTDRTLLDIAIKRATTDFYAYIIRNSNFMGADIHRILIGEIPCANLSFETINHAITGYFVMKIDELIQNGKAPEDFDLIDCIAYCITYNTPIDCVLEEGVLLNGIQTLHLDEYAPLNDSDKEYI